MFLLEIRYCCSVNWIFAADWMGIFFWGGFIHAERAAIVDQFVCQRQWLQLFLISGLKLSAYNSIEIHGRIQCYRHRRQRYRKNTSMSSKLKRFRLQQGNKPWITRLFFLFFYLDKLKWVWTNVATIENVALKSAGFCSVMARFIATSFPF